MCAVKTGEMVENEIDLQNLVTSVILRRSDAFNEKSIVESVENELSGSRLLNTADIRKLVHYTLKIFMLNDYLYYQNGMYRAVNKYKAV